MPTWVTTWGRAILGALARALLGWALKAASPPAQPQQPTGEQVRADNLQGALDEVRKADDARAAASLDELRRGDPTASPGAESAARAPSEFSRD